MRQNTTNAGTSSSAEQPVSNAPVSAPGTASSPGDPGLGRKLGEHARDAAEDAAQDYAGKLVGKLFRWIGRRIGIKDRAPTKNPAGTGTPGGGIGTGSPLHRDRDRPFGR
jgi:hypothetical protein